MRLTKSRDDVILTGLLGGIGEHYNVDPTIIRIIFALIIFTGAGAGLAIFLYIVGAIVVPQAPLERRKNKRNIFNRKHKQTSSNEKSSSGSEIKEEDWGDF